MAHPVVQKLIDHMNSDDDFKTALVQSFDAAYATSLPEFDTYNIHNLNDYIRYLNEFVNWLPAEDRAGTNVYYHICMLYFILDFIPVSHYQNDIVPSSQPPWRWLTEWLIEYAQAMGKWMDEPVSLSDQSLKSFYNAKKYHMEDYPKPKGGWKTFNEFFARHINPAKRPVALGDQVLVSPADCAYDGQWDISDNAEVKIKGLPWPISELLYDEVSSSNWASNFAGGTFTHSFLAPYDYHRQHAPLEGVVVEAKVIPGTCYLEVRLSSDENGKPRLVMRRRLPRAAPSNSDSGDVIAPDSAGYQFMQARGLIIIDNPVAGLVAVLPVGMAQVSSVKLSVKRGDKVQKGQEISYFQLGGSDIVMVFQKDSHVQLMQKEGVHYNFGVQIGTVGD